MKKAIYIALFLLVGTSAWAQTNFQNISFNYDTSHVYEVGILSNAYSNSNCLTAVVMNTALSGGYVTREDRQYMSDRAETFNNAGTWLNTTMYYAQRLDSLFGKEKTGITFFGTLSDRQDNYGQFSKNSLNLALFGNKQFLGQTVLLGPTEFTQLRYQQLQLGWNKEYESGVNVSVAASYLYGQSLRRGRTNNLELIHSEYGDTIGISGQVIYQQTAPGSSNFMDYNGSGFSLALAASFPIHLIKDSNQVGRFEFTLSDVGYIFWNGTMEEYFLDTTYAYTGQKINNLFDPSAPTDGLAPDELIDSLFTKSNTAPTTTLPFTASGRLVQPWNKWTFAIGGVIRYQAFFREFFYAEASYKIGNHWAASGVFNYGAYGNFGGGASLQYFSNAMDITVGSTNLEGFIAPTKAAGQNIYVALKWKI